MSMYNPEPKFRPKVQPKVQPKVTVSSYIKESGQVGNWLFYNGAGDLLRDFSGEDNHGDILGPKWVDGPYGWGLDFDGVDDYVNMGNPPSLNPDYVTALAWIMGRNFDETPLRCVVEKPYTTFGDPYHQYCVGYALDANKPYACVSVGGSRYDMSGATTITNGNWYHLALTFDGSYLRLYVNGEEDPDSPVSVSGTLDTYDTDFELGRLSTDTGHEVDGIIKYARVYDRALSDAEIGEHFERTRGIFGV